MRKIYLFLIFSTVAGSSFAATQAPKLGTIDLKKYTENLPSEYMVERMDSQNKGVNDMYTVFKKTNASDRTLVYQLFDFNRDGKVDVVYHYKKGKKSKAEFDLDYDGNIDTVSEYDEAKGSLSKKTMVENDALTWKYWYNNELRRKEVDRNSDGEPDMWVHYRNGHVVKTEVDVNFDGKNIRLEDDLNLKQ